MALNFPNSPTLNQIYTDSTSGFSYQWNGTVWISFSAASSSQIKTLDDISGSFNNSTLTFALTSGALSISPPTSQSLIINLGGVIQDATDDYSVSGSNIVFSTAPTNGLSFSGVSLGPAIPVTVVTIPDGTVTSGSLTVAGLLSTSNLFVSGISTFVGFATHTGTIFGNNLSLTGIATASSVIVGSAVTINSSGINVTGITTITNASGTVTIGIGTTALLVEGNARVTGILTVGSASITLNGITDTINVGTGLTLSSGGINITGIITATSFVGSGSGLTGVGIGTNGSVNTTGIITASSFVGALTGNATGLSGSPNITVGVLTATSINVPPIPIVFSPAIGATNVAVASNIIITFNGTVAKGTGNITLRANSAGGTAFSTIGVSSSSVSISGGAVTIDPPSNIGFAVTTFVVVDAGAFSGLTTTSVNALINTYSFTTLSFAFSSINPANAATNIGIGTNITLTFNSAPTRGTGTITLRSGSTSGSVIETFDAASSGQISISGNDWILDPTSNLGFTTSIHTIIPSTAIQNYVGLNTTGADTHSFTTRGIAVGDSYEGGFLICKASPLRWVVSPLSAEVGRTWYLRNDANTTAQSVSGCTGWFVPTCAQLENPGYCCRSFWGPSPCFSSCRYWSSTEKTAPNAYEVAFYNGTLQYGPKSFTRCVRAFRCVTY